MKKLIAIILTVATVCNITLSAGALGIDKVIRKKGSYTDDYKLIYVSSEKLDDFLKNVDPEAKECYRRANSWKFKDVLTSSAFITIPTAVALLCYETVKMINSRLYKNNTEKQQVQNVAVPSGVKLAELCISYIILLAAFFWGFKIGQDNNYLMQILDCDTEKTRNKWIHRSFFKYIDNYGDLEDPYLDEEEIQKIRKNGVKIECWGSSCPSIAPQRNITKKVEKGEL